MIRQLWETDNWKHFWSIEAKAYSDIRDAHFEHVSLERFLGETVGLLGIIPAENYLHIMGWRLIVNESSEYLLTRIAHGAGLQNVPLSTDLSAASIVAHCYQVGLVPHPPQCEGSATAGATMAFGARPVNAKIPLSSKSVQANEAVDNIVDNGVSRPTNYH